LDATEYRNIQWTPQYNGFSLQPVNASLGLATVPIGIYSFLGDVASATQTSFNEWSQSASVVTNLYNSVKAQ
jgi:hypothetical protein